MKFSLSAGRRSATVKVAVIGLLTLVLLVPVGMIRGVIDDRTQIESVAVLDIRNAWGGDQLIAGPLLRLPFKAEKSTVYGSPYIEDRHALLVADNLTINVTGNVEMRYRGIHEIPVYSASMEMGVRFDLGLLQELGIDTKDVVWSDAEVLMGVSDIAAIGKVPVLSADAGASHFASTSRQILGLPPQVSSNVGSQLEVRPDADSFSANISLLVNGTGSLEFLPLAENTEVRASANWASPSFVGRRLPAEREVTDTGFSALWQTSSLGRQLPARWVDNEATPNAREDGVFGVRFIQPVGLYQQMFRALKYAVMFVGLTFVTYFLMETVANLRLHPLQYLLVGLSNTLFYLLLLSLAEHIGFGLAYITSACASSALIVTYSTTVLASQRRAMMMATILLGLYAFLYLTLTAETYALLAGSIGLWFILAVVMYLTRKINWYSAGAANQKQAVEV